MNITILGATGTLGRLVADHLAVAGHELAPASRASGVDVTTGAGLDEALADADVAIDCLNVETMSAQIARRILAERGSIAGRRPRLVAELPYLGRAIATDGLLPRDALVDDVRLGDWLTTLDG